MARGKSLKASMVLFCLAGSCWAVSSDLAAKTEGGETLAVTGTVASAVDAYPNKAAPVLFRQGVHQQDIVEVRFNRGLMIRERNGFLTDMGTGVLADPAVARVLAEHMLQVTNQHTPMNVGGGGATDDANGAGAAARPAPKAGPWERMHEVDEAVLARLCATAEKNLGQPVADLNLAFFLHLPAGSDVDAVCRSLNALGIVEMAEPHQMGMTLPVAPDFRLEQNYGRSNFEHGTNAFAARAVLAGDASNVTVCDIEYGFNAAHEDLPFVQVVRGPVWALPSDSTNQHGTAVLGELFAENDNQGTVGLAVSARPMFASQAPNGNNNPAAAISTALANMVAGDVILLEMQVAGPNFVSNPNGSQMGLVPSEWVRSTYDAIRVAVGNGVHVVEAAGNGAENLDGAVYQQGNGGHYPFLVQNDSGAIIVGAGASGEGSAAERTRLSFSCFGRRVNVQGWGELVMTTGYGTTYAAEGANRFYTKFFSGTSSASPIVAGCVAVVESIFEEAQHTVLTPYLMRTYLVAFGQAQPPMDAAATHIGPLPDVLATVHALSARPVNDDCDGAIDLSLSNFGRIGSTLGATQAISGSASCADTAGMPDVWYRVVAPFDGGLRVSTCGTNDYVMQDAGIDTAITLHAGNCFAAETECGNTAGTLFCTADGGRQADATAFATMSEGQTMYVRVTSTVFSRPGPFVLTSDFYGAHDTCENAMDMTSRNTVRAGLRGMTGDLQWSSCTGVVGAPDAWHKFTACTTGTLQFSTCGTNDLYGQDNGLDTVLSVYDGCGPDAVLIDCNDDTNSLLRCYNDQGIARDSMVNIPVVGGHTYYARVSDYWGRTDRDYILNAYFTIGNDTCRDAALVDEGTVYFNTSCATDDGYREQYCSQSPSYGKDLWYEYFVAVPGPVIIETCGSSFDTQLAVYSACWDGDNAPTRMACNDDACGLSSRVVINANLYDLLHIRVGGYNGSSGPGMLTITGGREHCAADFNRDGGVDGADVDAFFQAWESGLGTADVNQDGGVDGSDVEAFFAVWEAGGC